jgi:hypothetical protein
LAVLACSRSWVAISTAVSHPAVFAYYHRPRTHLSLEKDAPDRRPIERPAVGRVVPMPEVGGRHHRYARQAA